jgi:hypothetical protein
MAREFLTLKQLRERTWKNQDEAILDLKRAGLKPVGTDYVLGEHTPGSKVWQLLDRTDADGSQEPPTAKPAKAAKAPKKTAKSEHPGDADMKAKAAKATGYDVHFRVSPTKKLNEQADTLEAARAIAARMNAEHGKNGRRAMIYARQAKGPSIPITGDDPPVTKVAEKVKGAKAKPADAPEPEPAPEPAKPAEPANDMTPLPAANGPYNFRLDQPPAQHSLLPTALEWSRKTGFVVAIIDKAGNVVRKIDGRLGGKRPTRTATRVATRTPRAPQGEGKMATATRLLMRPEGASADEISKATGWPTGQRHINKLAKLGGLKIVNVRDKHWRLVKA